MATIRLDSDERRKMIVAAAAGISEALLFRHFPRKKHLYTEILRLGCEGDPALERLATLQPSTETLVCMVRFMVRRFLLGAEADRAEFDTRLRLLLHSFLEDGEFARLSSETVCGRVVPLFEASLAAAVAAGDAAPRNVATANRFWFAHHVAAMMAFAALPGGSCVPYEGDTDTIVEEASTFILRGIGVRDAAIAAATPAAPRLAAD